MCSLQRIPFLTRITVLCGFIEEKTLATILEEIYKHKLSEVAEDKRRVSLEVLKEQCKKRKGQGRLARH